MHNKLIIQVAGHARAGKDTVSDYLAATYGFTLFRPSDAIRAYAAQHNIGLIDRSDFARARTLMQQEDPDCMVTAARNVPAELVCVSGLRVARYAAVLQSEDNAKIIALDASPEIRFQRSLQAPDGDGKHAATFEAFVAAERAEQDHGVDTQAILDMADYHIDANQDLPTVLAAVDDIIRPLIDERL